MERTWGSGRGAYDSRRAGVRRRTGRRRDRGRPKTPRNPPARRPGTAGGRIRRGGRRRRPGSHGAVDDAGGPGVRAPVEETGGGGRGRARPTWPREGGSGRPGPSPRRKGAVQRTRPRGHRTANTFVGTVKGRRERVRVIWGGTPIGAPNRPSSRTAEGPRLAKTTGTARPCAAGRREPRERYGRMLAMCGWRRDVGTRRGAEGYAQSSRSPPNVPTSACSPAW